MTNPTIPFDIVATASGTAVRTSGGTFLRLTGSPVPLSQLHALAGGHGVALDAAGQASWKRVQSAVTARHELEAGRVWPPTKGRVLLICTEPALAHMAADLAELGADVCTVAANELCDLLDVGGVRRVAQVLSKFEPSLVIWLADGMPPWKLWKEFDTIAECGVAWLRMHREGSQLWVDPISLDSTDASSAQVLKRRLAASGTAEELTAWLLASANIPRPLSVLAGRIVGLHLLDMVRAWAFDDEQLWTHRTHAWQFNTRSLTASEHPVLGYPEPAPVQ